MSDETAPSAPALRLLSSRATEALLAALVERLSDAGVVVAAESAGGVDVARRLRAGEAADLVVLAADAVDALAAEGVLDAASVRPLFDSPVVLGVPDGSGAAPPRTEDELLALLRGASGIAYSTGPSGTAFVRWLEGRVGDELADRLVQAPAGTPVATLLADGRAGVGVQQESEVAGSPGVTVLGPLPGSAAVTSTFSGAVASRSEHPGAAARALALLGDPATAEVVRAHHMSRHDG